jgi:hypothetical protein
MAKQATAAPAPAAPANDNRCVRVHKNCEAAYQKCGPHKALLDQLYEYIMPYRAPAGSQAAAAEERVDRIFDGTATKAAFRFAGRMSQDVTPAFQRFFELKIGPYLEVAGDAKKQIEEELAVVSRKISAVLEGAEFSVASNEMYLDLFGGTGALLMLEDERDVLRFVAVPVGEIALREDGLGRVNGIYWKKSYAAEDVPNLWPSDKVKLSDDLAKMVREKPDEPVLIVQASEYDPKAQQWHFHAYRADHAKEGAIYETSEATCPWLTPRFWKVPGEPMGRGPGLTGLPTAKTLNKVTELTIKAAAFAILGLWTYKNDRVFNPKTARMKPGAFWAVGSTGGSMGASVQRLDVPGRFDISNLILQDLRESLKQAMLDDTLPPDGGAVRSATEIVERMKRLSADLSGAYARMVLEIVRPLIQRVIDVLYRRKLIETRLNVDQLLTRVEVVSPIAKLQQAQDVSSLVEWLQIIASIGGPQMMMLTAKVEEVFTDIGRKLGISERLIRSDAEKKAIQQLVAAMVAQAQMAQAAPPGGAPPAGQLAAA